MSSSQEQEFQNSGWERGGDHSPLFQHARNVGDFIKLEDHYIDVRVPGLLNQLMKTDKFAKIVFSLDKLADDNARYYPDSVIREPEGYLLNPHWLVQRGTIIAKERRRPEFNQAIIRCFAAAGINMSIASDVQLDAEWEPTPEPVAQQPPNAILGVSGDFYKFHVVETAAEPHSFDVWCKFWARLKEPLTVTEYHTLAEQILITIIWRQVRHLDCRVLLDVWMEVHRAIYIAWKKTIAEQRRQILDCCEKFRKGLGKVADQTRQLTNELSLLVQEDRDSFQKHLGQLDRLMFETYQFRVSKFPVPDEVLLTTEEINYKMIFPHDIATDAATFDERCGGVAYYTCSDYAGMAPN